MTRPTANLAPHAFGAPAARARLRVYPADFEVDEQLPVEPCGDGEHLWLHACKTGVNTAWLADALARHYGVPRRDVGYAGRKDRHARTLQWFSVRLPGKAEAPPPPVLDDVEWLTAQRHRRKLATGALTGNRFRLVLRDVVDPDDTLAARLSRAAANGVPNWFGPQRFGRDAGNLDLAWDWLVDGRRPRSRNAQSIALSAARAWAFNRVLAARVADDSWHRLLPGERAMLAGSHSHFAVPDATDPALVDRLARGDVSPTGPLPGRGGTDADADCERLETHALAALAPLVDGLARARVDAVRRALILRPEGLEWQRDGDVLTLAFTLPAGCFATALLHALVEYDDLADRVAGTWC